HLGYARDLHSFPTRRSSDLARPSRSPRAGPDRIRRDAIRRPARGGGPHLSAPSGFGRAVPRASAEIGGLVGPVGLVWLESRARRDRKSTRLNSSHVKISYAV